jgi:hypothetical protein
MGPSPRNKCFLYDLPDEILHDQIVHMLPQSDLAALRRASKLFYDFSTRPLYRRISLTKLPQLVKCCKTLTNPNFNAAELVHAFMIDIPKSVCPSHFVL